MMIMERAITLNTKGACTRRFLKLMVSLVKGNVDETFIEGSIFLPFSTNHTTYATSGIKSRRLITLANIILFIG
jgi:hypothetical protein